MSTGYAQPVPSSLLRVFSRSGSSNRCRTRLTAPRPLRADLEAAKLPEYDGDSHRLDFHSFRHTAGTWLSEHGVDLKVVQEILGHRTFAMTADRYTHARLERVAAEMQKLPELRSTGTDDAVACHTLDMEGSNDGPLVSTRGKHDRDSDNENAVSERRSGGIGRRGGLKIR